MTFIFWMHIIFNSQLELISYTFQLRQHAACPSYALIIMVGILNSWSVAVFIVSWLIWSQQFN